MLKILLVSIASPPKSDPESLQVGRYMKYLAKHPCRIELITTANPTLYMETDPALETYNTASRTFTYKLIEQRYVNAFLSRYFPILTQFPDPKWSFRFFDVSRVQKPDIIYSRSYPLSSTLLAQRVKKKFDVPWVLHLSDPWALSFEGDSPATNFRGLARKWNRRRERQCFALADTISLTSSKTIDLYKQSYPEYAHKFILTPNVFDEDLTSDKSIQFGEKLQVVYTGGFGEKRSPLFYLKGISEFLRENPDVSNKVEFIFTGPLTRLNKSIFDKFQCSQIRHLGVISYNTMLSLQQQAHVLVNIDTDIPNPEHSVFFPSKLLEYFAANRRVLNIGNSHSTSSSIVKGKFGDAVEFEDHAGLKNILRSYYSHFVIKDERYFTLSHSRKEFEAGFNATKLFAHFTELTGGI